jgi:two-component system, OmpR family, KDP operon response regulator KdpE
MNAIATVLVVDEDKQIQRLLKLSLAAAGYNSLSTTSGTEALKLIATQAPDLAVLSQRLPDMEGTELIRRVRAWSNIPIIAISVHRDDAEEIATLDLGADDYVRKPFSPGRLMARVRTALRHRAKLEGEATSFNAGGLVVDTLARTVTRGDLPVQLTAREFELLLFLVRHAGRVVTHRQVLEAVWGPSYVENTQYLRVFIGRLRQKIERNLTSPRFITTLKGVGYRFSSGS